MDSTTQRARSHCTPQQGTGIVPPLCASPYKPLENVTPSIEAHFSLTQSHQQKLFLDFTVWKHVVRQEEKKTNGHASLSQAGSSQWGKFTSDLFSSSFHPPPSSPSFFKLLFQHWGVSTIQIHLQLPTYRCPKGHGKQRCCSSPLADLCMFAL